MITGNFFSFLLTLSAIVCIILGIVSSLTGRLFGNSSPWPTSLILFIGASFYLAMAALITAKLTRKKQ